VRGQHKMPFERKERLESIQILRGLAAFNVMMFHFTCANNNFMAKLPAIGDIFQYGGQGVQAFFVISGFVIPYYMKKSNYKANKDSFSFLGSRLIRLEPPYIASIAISVVLAYLASKAPGFQGPPFVLDIAGLSLHLLYLAPWFGKGWVNGVYWTLAIEFQYYIFMLIFGQLIISKNKWNVLLFLCISLLMCYLSRDERLICISLCYFMFGFIAFIYYNDMLPRWQIAIAFIVVLATALYLGSLSKFVVALITCFLIFVPLKKPLPILSFLGTISYSLYLFHVPIGDRVINLGARIPPLLLLGACLIAIIVTIAASWLMWRLVEHPAVRLAHLWTARRRRVSGPLFQNRPATTA
jgi:peptidoglycan/LPS O-acetylase OafA/YrhL